MHPTNHPRLRLLVVLAALLQTSLGYLILTTWFTATVTAPRGGRP